MQREEAYHWLLLGERRQRILLSLKQPMTARQLSRTTRLSLKSMSKVLRELSVHGFVSCLNLSSRRSRLYWLSDLGKSFQQELRTQHGLPLLKYDFANVPWEIYGWVLYNHRAVVLKTLAILLRAYRRPVQPSEIKRKARFNDSTLRMSANNVRDVIREMKAKEIVKQYQISGKRHPGYELTELGWKLEELRARAESQL